MSDGLIITVTIAVLLGISAFLFGSLIVHIRRERRTGDVRRIWANFGLSLCFCTLFLVSWAAQGLTEWGEYRQTQAAHGQTASLDGFVVEFGQSTLENWQSEFLQLFSFVVLSALLIHRGSAESKDGDERLEAKIDAIARRLDDLDAANVATTRAGSNVPHAGTERPHA
jgi:hypothetical protein